MNQRESQNGTSAHNAQDSENRIASMLSALPRIDAPDNFEFGVKAKIAARRDVQGGVRILPFLKVAAPLCLLLVIGAFFVFYGPSTDRNVPDVVQNPAPSQSTTIARAPQLEQPVPANLAPTVSEPRAAGEITGRQERDARSIEPVRRTPVVKRWVAPATDVRTNGGSIDRTLGSANTISPPGFGGGDIPVGQVLGMLGVSADFVDGSWKVRSSAENTLARKAGMAAGDVIEAIDGRLLGEKTTFKGPVTPRSVRVKRDGKQIELKLGN